jgi:hypothetical protein
VWEDVSLTDVEALKFAKASAVSPSLATMYVNLHSSYRTFCQQFRAGGAASGTLQEMATYTLGTWTYAYEVQTRAQRMVSSPADEAEPALTLDDVLLEYLPPTHPHLPLLLGYTTSLFREYAEWLRPILPALIALTMGVSRRAALELVHALFAVAGYGWEDFTVCMAVSKLVEREDEYLAWLSREMDWRWMRQYTGHFLRIPREYESFTKVVQRAFDVGVTKRYDLNEVGVCFGGEATRPDVEEMEDALSQLVQKVCLYALQSGATRDIINLYCALPSKRAALPSLNLLIHLTIQTIRTDFPDAPLENLAKKPLDLNLLRTTLPPTVLKSHISRLLANPPLASLAVSIARDWKEHINYDDDEEDDESTSDFLDRVEREYLTATEGVVWRFEDVLSEWMGVWPDGRQLWSNQIPRTQKMLPSVVVDEEEEEDDDEEEDFAGSLVKRVVRRSGLIAETPVPKRDGGRTSERKGVLERLFKLSSIGQTEKRPRTERTRIKLIGSEEGESFLQRIGLVRKAGAERGNVGTLEERTAVEDDTPPKRTRERTSPRRLPGKGRKRRRFDHTSDEEGSIDEEESDVENIVPTRPPRKGRKRCKSGTILLTQLVDTSDEEDPATSDVDELSISIKEPPRAALARLAVNRRVSSSMLVRESSPIALGDESDDELAM